MLQVRFFAKYFNVVEVALVGRHQRIGGETQLDLLCLCHCDGPGTVQRHLVIARVLHHLVGYVVAAKSAVQHILHLKPTRTQIGPRWPCVDQKLVNGPESRVFNVVVRAESEPQVTLR